MTRRAVWTFGKDMGTPVVDALRTYASFSQGWHSFPGLGDVVGGLRRSDTSRCGSWACAVVGLNYSLVKLGG